MATGEGLEVTACCTQSHSRSPGAMGRSPSASAHPQLPSGCLARGQSPIWEGGLTLVVLDQLLQRVEVVSWGDVEATAVQRADLVMLHCPAPQLVPVPHRERVRAWEGRGELAAPRGAHSHCTPSFPTPGMHRASSSHPTVLPPLLQPQTPKAASKGHIPLSLPWGWDRWQQHRDTSRESTAPPVPPCSTADPQGGEGAPLAGKGG